MGMNISCSRDSVNEVNRPVKFEFHCSLIPDLTGTIGRTPIRFYADLAFGRTCQMGTRP